MPKLTRVEIHRLLGHFDHTFEFPEDWKFAILHGPNGIGKTKLLELIHRVLSRQFWAVGSIPFESARFEFSDKSTLNIESIQQSSSEDAQEFSNFGSATFTLKSPGRKSISWRTPRFSGVKMQQLTRIFNNELAVVQMGSDSWHDSGSEEVLTTSEVLQRYGDISPRLHRLLSEFTAPSREVEEFFESFDIHFIQTQRLFSHTRPLREPGAYRPTRVSASQAMVRELAADLKQRLADALAENSRKSQQLDRDFPRRIITEQESMSDVSQEAIEQKYTEQNILRGQLADIALLDTSIDLPLPSQELSSFERRILWAYLGDSEKKLQTFIPILERVTLLKEIVNSRFLYKTMEVDRGKGFKFTSSSGIEISPEALSSGEQHELVLYYNLLFKAERGLVLIDEPEISLHIAWQKAFLSDLSRIAEVSDLRFIVATHSPQIIHKSWTYAIALHAYPEEEED